MTNLINLSVPYVGTVAPTLLMSPLYFLCLDQCLPPQGSLLTTTKNIAKFKSLDEKNVG